MTEYDAVIFDNDGVLVTPPAPETQAMATKTAFRDVGIERVERSHVDELITGVSPERLDDICKHYDTDSKRFWSAWERRDEQSQLEKFETGDRDRYDDVAVVETIARACAVVSNNHHSTIDFVIEFFDMQGLFETYYGREKTIESLARQKPNTHYLDRALTDLDAESAIYVGDTERDVIAADRAGIDSVYLHRSHCEDLDPSISPTHTVSTLEELPAILRG